MPIHLRTSAQVAQSVSDETGSGSLVFATSPTLVTPDLGTPSAGVLTNCTGTAAGLTAGNVTTNANLTGHVTSVGNAAVLGSFTLAELNTAVSDATLAVSGFVSDVDTQITPNTAITLDHASNNEVALDLSYTVNKAAGDDTGLKLNQTDTLSNGTSLLVDLQVGGVSTMTVDNVGQLRLDRAQTFGSTTGLMFGDGNSGFYEPADNNLRVILAGTDRFIWTGTLYRNSGGGGPGMVAASSSRSVPTLLPDHKFTDTGVGAANNSDELSLINSGTETARLTLGESNGFLHLYDDSFSGGTDYQRLEITGQTAGNFRIQTAAGGLGTAPDIEIDSKVILDPSDTYGTGTGLWFGADGNTGIYESAADTMRFRVAGATQWTIQAGTFYANSATGVRLEMGGATGTNPVFNPNRTDTTTGIGANAAGEISLITEAVEQMRLTSAGHTINGLLDEATGNEVALTLDYTVNKLTSGDDIGLRVNKTDTASPGGSYFIDCKLDGTSKMLLTDGGKLRFNIDDTFGTEHGVWFGATGDTGLYEFSADNLRVRLGGSTKWIWTTNSYKGITNGAAAIVNEASSSTNPVLCPDNSDFTTGIGANAAGAVSIITAATEAARFDLGDSNNFLHLYNDSGSTNWERLEITGQTGGNFLIQTAKGGAGTARHLEVDCRLILDPSDTFGTGTGLWFGSLSAQNGIYQSSAANIRFRSGATDRWLMNGSHFQSLVANGLHLDTDAATGTAPVFVPNKSYQTTGIGSNAANQISLICSATEIVRVTSTLLDLQPGTEMQMDLTTEDSGFINFKATADADATSAISTLTTSGAVTHHIQVKINGVTAWIPCSTTDPS